VVHHDTRAATSCDSAGDRGSFRSDFAQGSVAAATGDVIDGASCASESVKDNVPCCVGTDGDVGSGGVGTAGEVGGIGPGISVTTREIDGTCISALLLPDDVRTIEQVERKRRELGVALQLGKGFGGVAAACGGAVTVAKFVAGS